MCRKAALENKEALCDSLRARVGTQVPLQLHTGRIPAEHFCFIGKGISYKAKKGVQKTGWFPARPFLLHIITYFITILTILPGT